MQKLRITVSNVLKNQLPNFVKEEYPLVEELFSEYYRGQEYQGGVLDILQNIDKYIKLNNLTNLVDKTKITSSIDEFSEVIPVASTDGFPDYYGLIQIDSEIILYKSRTSNSFVNCVRGFSGINSYDKTLNFEKTSSANHSTNAVVKNLNILFLNEFLIKVKKQFAPGFENRNFFSKTYTDTNTQKEVTSKVNQNIFIKQLRDFYSSKGTDISFKILFKALFGDDVEIIKPRDFLIRPSDSQYRVNKELVIEAIEGDPFDLVDTTIYQTPLVIDGKEFIFSAYGTVNRVQTISRKEKTYYIVGLDYDYNKDINLKGSVYGEFVIGPKTIVTDTSSSESIIITVDSTYGFPEKNGSLRINFSDGTTQVITYKRKNLNQFIECEGINREIIQGQEIYLNYYCVGGNTVGNDENPIKFRITGVLAEATTASDSHYIVEGNRINLRTLGKDIQTPGFNNWKFNIATSYNVKDIILSNASDNTYLITLYDDHIFYAGDSVKITSRPQLIPGTTNAGVFEFDATITNSVGKYSFNCSNVTPRDPSFTAEFLLDTSLQYSVERKINKFNFNYNSSVQSTNDKYISDVQNVYRDSEGSLYVASQSLPSYQDKILTLKDDTVVLSSNVYISVDVNTNNVDVIDKVLNIGRHPFRTGDAVYYQSGTGNNSLNIPEAVYYVKSIGDPNNSTQIKLANSRTNIDNNIFVNVSLNSAELTGSDNKLLKSTNELIYFKSGIQNSLSENKFERFISAKNIIKKISTPIEELNKKRTESGQIGILINGVEILNYKSNDFIYYGSIDDIKLKSSGKNYDIINPPKITITDKIGAGASAICHVSGFLSRIDVLDGGFDYETPPLIEISGGNGTGAQAEVNMTTLEYSVSLLRPQVNVSSNIITFNKKHKFYDGENVTYTCTQDPIGGLEKNTIYYVASESEYSIKLYQTYGDSISKLNPINLINYTLGTHTLTSVEKKSTIGYINIVKSGTGYSNKKIIAKSQNISIFSNSIKIPRHGYNTGEKIVYSSTNTPIGVGIGTSTVGLSTTTEYFVYKLNDDEFKLCPINTESNDKNFYLNTKQFVDLTSQGTGNHIFNCPPISVKVVGSFKNKNLDISEVQAQIVPVFRGSINSIFIESGGVGYGSSEIINYNRQPNFSIENGTGAELRPIISNGRISEVLIVNSGRQYTAIPEIEVVGTGTGAKLLPIISNGRIQEIKIVSSGINYDPNSTALNVISAGSGASVEFILQNWNINQVERTIQNRNVLSNDVVLNDTKNEYNERMTQITHSYAPRKLRENLIVSRIQNGQVIYSKDLTLDSSGSEKINSEFHSPIIGWSYDGNPIYGPFGFVNPDGSGGIKKIKSGYVLSANRANRPSLNNFPRGLFVEDYEYDGTGDLDEFNGRFCVTPEFPNGVYAYFATFGDIDSIFSTKYLRPIFPYLIGNYYKSKVIDFNFDNDQSQNLINFEVYNFIRNTTPYKFISNTSTYNYVFNPIDYEQQYNRISRVGTGKIDDVTILSGGKDYKVGDKITLSEDEFGDKSYAEITKVKGSDISSISVNFKEINGVEFGYFQNSKTIVGVASTPHQLKDQDNISIIGLNEIIINPQKNISSRINVFTNQLSLKNDVINGSVTNFIVDGNLSDRVIKPNDRYSIAYSTNSGQEELADIVEEIVILSVDRDNSSIRVRRGSTGFGTYFAGTTLVENPRRFQISSVDSSSKISSDEKFYPLNNEVYFNPVESIGLGTVGINSSILLNIIPLNSQVAINTAVSVATVSSTGTIGISTRTGLIFNNPQNSSLFKVGDYVSLFGSSNFSFDNIQKVKVLNVGIGSITIDYDSSSLNGNGVSAFVRKWETLETPIRSIYIPNHSLNTGDKIRYYKNIGGSSIGVSTNKVNSSLLTDGELLYAYKFDENRIGISRSIVGLTTGDYLNSSTGDSLLYFTSTGGGSAHSFKTEYDVEVGRVIKNTARVSVTKDSQLFSNENIYVSVVPSTTITNIVKYNKQNRRLVLNPKSFIEINLADSSIPILNHGYSTGDKVIHTTQDLNSSLDNDQIYFVVVIDNNNIKLATSYYNATLSDPITVVLENNSPGEISSINPAIKLYRNQTVKFDLTDRSLSFISNELTYSAFKFTIYKDSNFTEKFFKSEDEESFSVRNFGKIGITNDAAVEIKVSDKTPEKLFYKFELDNVNYDIPQNQSEYFIDDENINNNNTLFILDSVYSGSHKVYNVANNFFEYLLKERPEKETYSSVDSLLSYTTDSYSTLGEIEEVKVLSKDRKYRVLPGISSITTKTGSGSILFPYSKDIGSAKKVKIENIGFDYSSDYSLRPTGNLPQIIQVEPLNIFKEIKVVSVGKNYITAPNLIVLDGLTKIQDKEVELKFDPNESTVEIIQNSAGLFNKEPLIIPINNTNGIPVRSGSASFVIDDNDGRKLLTLGLGVSFSSLSDFPFAVGDRVLLENFRVLSSTPNEEGELEFNPNVKGINSSNYGYALFELSAVSAAIGGGTGSVTIDLSSYLNDEEIPGTYTAVNSLGYIVPEKYFPKFDVSLKKNDFILGEEVITTSGYTGIVEYWDKENEFVSVISSDKFITGDKLTGKTSNLRGVVGKVEFFDAEYRTDSNSVVERGWDTKVGFLNDNVQRIHDSDYYQYFSYALKSKTQLSEWNDAVSSLNHTAGFKKFGTLVVESSTPEAVSIGVSSVLNSVSDFFEVIDLNSYHNFDMVSENAYILGNNTISDQIIFNSKEIQDYSESIGNRVLMIDDFSSEFNNIARAERYTIIDRFPIYESRHRKYFAYVKDKLFFNERQFSIISLIHDNLNGYVNQYGKLQTVNELGTFDFVINGDEGQVQFKPYDYEYNDFDIDLVSYSLFDTFIAIGSTTNQEYSIGTIVKFENEVSTLPANSVVPVTISEIPLEYRSSKIILTINSKNGGYRESTELNIVHDGTNVYVSEYGRLFTETINPPVGLSTYSAYIIDSKINLDIVPYVGYGSTIEINTLKMMVRDNTGTVGGVLSENNTRLESGFINIPSSNTPTTRLLHSYSYNYAGGYYYISIQDTTVGSEKYQALEITTLNDQVVGLATVYATQFGSVITNDSFVGIGTFNAEVSGNRVNLYYTPPAGKNIDIRFFYNGIKTITESDIDTPQTATIIGLNQAQITSFNTDYIGTQNTIKRSFQLYHKKRPIMKRTFRANSSASVDLFNDRIIIPNHYFSTGELVTYDPGGDDPVGIATTTIAGIGLTDQLPSTLYIIKVNDLSVRVSASASEALKSVPSYLDLNRYGTGSQHTLTGIKGNSRSLITIDNMIQSPIVSSSTTTRLASELQLKDIRVKVNDPSIFIGGDIFKVDDEIIRIQVVGFGSTNTLLVNRNWMGTLPGIHSEGSVCTIIRGNYNIVDNKIHFYDPPYGKVPIVAENPRFDEVDYTGISTSSAFSGRMFNKSGDINGSSPTYSDNVLLDDISEQFTGLATVFALKENGDPVSGVSTTSLFVLVKDILQIPNNELRDNNGAFELGQNLNGETQIVFNQENQPTNLDIIDINATNIPSGGIILSVGSTFGSGYQPLKTAAGSAEVDNLGIITSISIGFTGSGYRLSGGKQILVSTASTVLTGTNIIPINAQRGLFDKFEYSTQKTCNVGIGTSLHSVSIVGYNTSTSTIEISRNTDVEIPESTEISINLDGLTAEIVDIGIRSESQTFYKNTYIGFTTVINGSISTDLNLINPGIAFTSFYDKFTTSVSIPSSSGSTLFYINDINDINENDYISINSLPLLKVVGIGNTYVQTDSSYNSSVSLGDEVLVRRFSPPAVIFDSPVGYSNVPLIYSTSSGSSGIGTGAKIKINIGENGNVNDFVIEDNGYGYKKSDILTVPVGGLSGVPLDSSAQFEEFKIFVDSVYNTKFSSWSVGDLQVIDNFDDLFDNSRKVFPIKINGSARSIRAKKGSSIDIQACLIVLYNDILQVPGQGYTFKGGSIIAFPEAPKYGDKVSIIFYRGNSEVDVLDADILETVKIGDGLKIVSDQKIFNQFERTVTDVVSSDYANTNPYLGKGISGDFNFLRPVVWRKQNVDLVVDGLNVGKDRIYYEPSIYPSTRIIQDIGIASTEVYVESLKTFFDNNSENIINADKYIIKIIDQTPIKTAIATCQVSSAGTIFNIDIIDGGYGYKVPPKVSIQNSEISVGTAYSMSLTSIVDILGISTTGLSSAIRGEQIVGTQSQTIALLKEVLPNGYGSTVSYLSLTSSKFIENEEIRFESSGMSAQVASLNDPDPMFAIAEATILNGVVNDINITNSGYGYTYGPISNLKVLNNGSGYPATLNPSNNVFYNARLNSITGDGIDATANIIINKDPISTNYLVDFELINSGSKYSVGDILEIKTFDNIGVGLTNRNTILTTPILLEVIEIKPPIVIIDSPTPEVEIIKNVDFVGDFGVIVGASYTTINVNDNVLIFDLYIPTNSYLRDVRTVGSAITISQLKENDYFVVSNSNIGNGVETLRNDNTTIGISTDYINNVYQVYSSEIVQKYISFNGIGTVYVNTITSKVDSFESISTSIDSIYGNYSWGKIGNLFNRIDPKEFNVNQNESVGISSNPIIQRFKKLRYAGYLT